MNSDESNDGSDKRGRGGAGKGGDGDGAGGDGDGEGETTGAATCASGCGAGTVASPGCDGCVGLARDMSDFTDPAACLNIESMASRPLPSLWLPPASPPASNDGSRARGCSEDGKGDDDVAAGGGDGAGESCACGCGAGMVACTGDACTGVAVLDSGSESTRGATCTGCATGATCAAGTACAACAAGGGAGSVACMGAVMDEKKLVSGFEST